MAESLRAEDISISLKANLEIFDKIDHKFSELNENVEKISNRFGKMMDNNPGTKAFGSINRQLTGIVNRFDKVSASSQKAFGSIKDGTSNSTSGLEKQAKQLSTVNDALKQTNSSAKEFNKSAKVTNKGVTQLNKQSTKNIQAAMQQASEKAKTFAGSTDKLSTAGSKFTRAGKSMAVASTAAGAVMLKGANDAVKLQNQYRVITNLATYGGEKQTEVTKNVAAMQKQGSRYAVQYGVDQKKISSGYEELVRRGYTTNQALAAQKTFLQGAIASGDDYADVVDNATSAIESFGLRSGSTTKMAQNSKMAVNQMAYAADLTATDFKGMGEALKYVGATSHSANQTLAGTASAIGVLSNNGQDASVAGTGLRQVLTRLMAPPTKGKYMDAMATMHLKPKDFKDAKGNLLSLQDIFKLINSRTKGMTDTKRGVIMNHLFGQTGMETGNILLKNADALRKLNGQVANSQKMKGGGYIAQLSEKNMMSAQAQINIFKQALKGLGISFATTVLPKLSGFLKAIDKVLYKINDLSPAGKEMVSFGLIAVAAFAPVTIAIGALLKSFNSISDGYAKLRGKLSKPIPAPAVVAGSTETTAQVLESETTGDIYSRTKQRVVASKNNMAARVTGVKNRASKAKDSISSYFNPDLSVYDGGNTRSERRQLYKQSRPQRVRSRIGQLSRNTANDSGLHPIRSIRATARFVKSAPSKATASVRRMATVTGEYFNPDLTKPTKHGVLRSRIGKVGRGTFNVAHNVGRAAIGRSAIKSTGLVSRVAGLAGRGGVRTLPVVGTALMAASTAVGAKKGKQGAAMGSAAGTAVGGIAGSFLGPVGGMAGSYVGGMLGQKAGSLLDKGKKGKSPITTIKSQAKKIAGATKAAWNIITHPSENNKKAASGFNYIDNNFGKSSQKIKNVALGLKKTFSNLSKGLKTAMKPLKSFGSWLGKSFGSTFKKIGKTISPVVKDIVNAFSSMGKALGKAVKQYFGGGKKKGIAKTIADTFSAVIKFVKPIIKLLSKVIVGGFKVVSAGIRGVLDLVKNIFTSSIGSWVGVFKGGLKTIQGVFSLFGDVLSGNWKKIGKDLGTIVSGVFDTIKHVIGAGLNTAIGLVNTALDGINGLIKKLPKKIRPNWNLHIDPVKFAKGTSRDGLKRDTYAMVNDGGKRELITLPDGNSFMFKNMREKAFLPKNTQILNGNDTEKRFKPTPFAKGTVKASSLQVTKPVPATNSIVAAINRLTKVVRGINRGGAVGNKKLTAKSATLPASNATIKTSSSKKKLKQFDSDSKKIWSDTTKKTSNQTNRISKNSTKDYSTATKKMRSSLSTFNTQSNRIWKDTYKDTKSNTGLIYKQSTDKTDDLRTNTVSNLQKMRKQYSTINNGIASDFDDAFSKLGPSASKAMTSAVKALNKGIKAIDTTLSEFGGNKQVLSTISYATGSKGPIPNNQLAVLNDAKTGPRQELVVRGNHLLKPHGQDVLTPLRKGDEVLNGSQAQQLIASMPHYAKGTGVSKDHLVDLAQKNAGNPKGAWNTEFKKNVGKSNGTVLGTGLLKTTKSAVNSVGPSWSNAMWGLINGTIQGGSGDGTLKPHFGSPFSESSGYGPRSGEVSDNHKGIDFSAPMGTPIPAQYAGTVVTAGSASGFGNWVVIRPDGMNINTIYGHMRRYRVHSGQHVKTGQIIANVGAEGEATGPHVHYELREGLGSGDPRPNPDTYKGKVKAAKSKTSGKGLNGLVKRELGSKALKWIEDNLQSYVGSVSMSGDVASRARSLASAIRRLYPAATKAGIAAVLGNWSFESGLNPGAVNSSGGASGLGQWLGGRKSALIAYAKKHGKSASDAGLQLSFALNGDGTDSGLLKSVLRGTGSVTSLAAKFSNQWERGGYTSEHVAGARKIQSALKFAKGGKPPKNETVQVNEEGQELFKTTRDGTIIPHKESQRLVTKSSVGAKVTASYKVNVTVNGGDSDKRITKLIKKALSEHDEELVTMINGESGDDANYEFL